MPFKSQDAFDTKHIISHKTCYDILRCGLKLNINLNRRDQFGAESYLLKVINFGKSNLIVVLL